MASMAAGPSFPIFIVDAFTDEPFRGNPAAVCLLPHDLELDEDVLQTIASEMNLSETAYIQHVLENSSFESSDTFKLRWFTPSNEVQLCGHATLASAATLFFHANNSCSAITFNSKSGPLVARRNGDSITLNFPLNPTEKQNKDEVVSVIKELCNPSLVQDVEYSPTTKKLLLRLHDDVTRDTLENLTPDTRSLETSDKSGYVKGVIVTLKGSPDMTYDFLSRYFAPWNGIPEDPVTGSAHTVLADYWRKQLGKSEFYARQCSKRGGSLHVVVVGNRVELSGQAKIVLEGKLHV